MVRPWLCVHPQKPKMGQRLRLQACMRPYLVSEQKTNFVRQSPIAANPHRVIGLKVYRAQHNLPDSPLAIIIQELVEGEVSGVLFYMIPLCQSEHYFAAYGLGEGVVQGTVPCDTFCDCSARNPISANHQGSGGEAAQRSPQLVELQDTPPGAQCLTNDTIHRLAKLGRQLASACGSPQDVEWTVLGDELIVLQTNSTTLAFLKESVCCGISKHHRKLLRAHLAIDSYVCVPSLFHRVSPLLSGDGGLRRSGCQKCRNLCSGSIGRF